MKINHFSKEKANSYIRFVVQANSNLTFIRTANTGETIIIVLCIGPSGT